MGMDRQRTSDPRRRRQRWMILVALFLLGNGILAFSASDFVATHTVDRERLLVSQVRRGPFREAIRLSGTVQPGKRYFIDARERGMVSEVRVQPGAQVAAGDTLLVLSNSDLQLEVMQREAQLLEQSHQQQQTRRAMARQALEQRQQLAAIAHELDVLRPRMERLGRLSRDSAIPAAEYEEVQRNYRYQKRRQQILQQALRRDSLERQQQRAQLRQARERIQRNLNAVQGITDRLRITAPFAGRIADFEVEPGESIAIGQRLGELYHMGGGRIQAEADERYLDRIRPGQTGETRIGTLPCPVEVTQVYPSIEDGRFQVRCRLKGDSLPELRKGQSLRLTLFLGDAEEETLLLPTGAFFRQTGGQWVFVMQGNQAVRRAVKLGRKNPGYYEVLSGLQAGDKVITSSYQHFQDYQKLELP